MKARLIWFFHDVLRFFTGDECAAAPRIGVSAVHAHAWWCGYCRAWMSATLHHDLGEKYITCLNCTNVLTRLKGA